MLLPIVCAPSQSQGNVGLLHYPVIETAHRPPCSCIAKSGYREYHEGAETGEMTKRKSPEDRL
jgi:hypothetical protein